MCYADDEQFIDAPAFHMAVCNILAGDLVTPTAAKKVRDSLLKHPLQHDPVCMKNASLASIENIRAIWKSRQTTPTLPPGSKKKKKKADGTARDCDNQDADGDDQDGKPDGDGQTDGQDGTLDGNTSSAKEDDVVVDNSNGLNAVHNGALYEWDEDEGFLKPVPKMKSLTGGDSASPKSSPPTTNPFGGAAGDGDGKKGDGDGNDSDAYQPPAPPAKGKGRAKKAAKPKKTPAKKKKNPAKPKAKQSTPDPDGKDGGDGKDDGAGKDNGDGKGDGDGKDIGDGKGGGDGKGDGNGKDDGDGTQPSPSKPPAKATKGKGKAKKGDTSSTAPAATPARRITRTKKPTAKKAAKFGARRQSHPPPITLDSGEESGNDSDDTIILGCLAQKKNAGRRSPRPLTKSPSPGPETLTRPARVTKSKRTTVKAILRAPVYVNDESEVEGDNEETDVEMEEAGSLVDYATSGM